MPAGHPLSHSLTRWADQSSHFSQAQEQAQAQTDSSRCLPGSSLPSSSAQGFTMTRCLEELGSLTRLWSIVLVSQASQRG